MTPLLSVKNLKKHFPIHGGVLYRQIGQVYAVDDVSFEVKKGETLGLVGESGCGKSTLGRTLLNLYPPTSGKVIFNEHEISKVSQKKLRGLRKKMQIIFQDPMESLNSRLTVGRIVEEGFLIHGMFKNHQKRRAEVMRLLDSVGLSKNAIDHYPHEFSGGQRQRIGIARAISVKPELLICDEPVSALDVSVQSQILNLLNRLKKELDLTMIFIAHNLAVVKYISDKVAVMYLGKIVEMGPSEDLYKKPLHPYTQALIAAIPVPDPEAPKRDRVLEGDVPSPINPPSGCYFHPRCPKATDVCRQKSPALRRFNKDHMAACHFI
ncbi:ABC transporter ATP-binding protein [Elusimicrobiota bacterium]